MLKKKLSTAIVSSLFAALLLTGCGSPEDSMQEETGISKDQAAAAMSILKDVGTTEFGDTSVVNKDKQMFYVNDKKYGRVFFQLKDGAISSVENTDGTVVYANGAKIIDLKDVALTEEEKAEFQVLAMNAIKAQLKAPASADFDNWHIKRSKDGVVIAGTVDAQNSFGAKLRRSFLVTANYTTKEVVTASLM